MVWSLPHNHDQLYSKQEHLINKEPALYKFWSQTPYSKETETFQASYKFKLSDPGTNIIKLKTKSCLLTDQPRRLSSAICLEMWRPQEIVGNLQLTFSKSPLTSWQSNISIWKSQELSGKVRSACSTGSLPHVSVPVYLCQFNKLLCLPPAPAFLTSHVQRRMSSTYCPPPRLQVNLTASPVQYCMTQLIHSHLH